MLATSLPKPNMLHPFFICSMTSFTAGRQPLGSLDKRTDRQPSTSQQILPARGRLHPSGSALDVICNSAFKGFVAEAHCLLSRSSKIIVELNSQEQLERKQEKKIPTLNVKGHLKASRFQGFLKHLNPFARPCGCTVSFHWAHTMQDMELTWVFV